MSRGNDRQAIVRDDADRAVRLEMFRRAVERDAWIIHAFALMTNHDHLLVQTPRANLSAGLRGLNSCYASYFNRRHERTGHLFQERPKAHLIEESGYFATCSRYIHLNPRKAGLVDDPIDYRWSSFPGYVDPDRGHDFVEYSSVLLELGTHEAAARATYKSFVQSAMNGSLVAPWAEAGRDGIVGSKEFEDRVRGVLDHVEHDVELPRIRKMQYRPSLDQVIAAADRLFGCVDRRVGRRCDGPGRCFAALLAREIFGYRSRDVAIALGYRNSSSVSTAIRRAQAFPQAMLADIDRLRIELLENREVRPDD